MELTPAFSDVQEAASRLHADVLQTPVLQSAALDDLAGRKVFVKAENLQWTGSFKYRGARNKILLVPPSERKKGVIAFSSGNHAQGVALAAKRANCPARLVMPADAPGSKIRGVQSLGGEVIFYDRVNDDREAITKELLAQHGGTMIAPFDDKEVIAGQGTVGLELAEQAIKMGVDLQAVVTNIGGGGLTAGVGLALEQLLPDAKLYGVEPTEFDDHAKSLAAGKRVKNKKLTGSICDALLAEQPGKLTFSINKTRLAAGLAVSDDQVRNAMKMAFSTLKIVLEPGGAASLAAVLGGLVPGSGPVAVIATGGNVDAGFFAKTLTS